MSRVWSSARTGKMNRSEYRKFKIKTVVGSNDVASMREAVFRRYRRLLDEGKPLPDLIMIDGGKRATRRPPLTQCGNSISKPCR